MNTPHAVTVTSYAWTLGERWRWDCLCGRGVPGYVGREWADRHSAAHLAWANGRAGLDEDVHGADLRKEQVEQEEQGSPF